MALSKNPHKPISLHNQEIAVYNLPQIFAFHIACVCVYVCMCMETYICVYIGRKRGVNSYIIFNKNRTMFMF